MASLSIDSVTKTFDSPSTTAVDRLSLHVQSGELLVLLGPSGCGKTTLLRLIAGLEEPTSGTISLDEKNLSGLPPQDRSIGMAFQYPALLPQLTVAQNIGLGPKLRRVPKTEALQRVRDLAALLNLELLLERMPTTLSGGEQQRVSLARALANQPAVLLLDEPLANLDAVSRTELREAIRTVQRQLRLTTLYVTHDQLEAAAVSDRIAILNQGRVEQAGAARELYHDPENLFVARFFGPDQPNVIDGALRDGKFHAKDSDWSFPTEIAANTRATCAIRMRAIRPGGTFTATVKSLQQTGWSTIATLESQRITLRAELDSSIDAPPSGTFQFDFAAGGVFFFDPSGKRIRS